MWNHFIRILESAVGIIVVHDLVETVATLPLVLLPIT